MIFLFLPWILLVLLISSVVLYVKRKRQTALTFLIFAAVLNWRIECIPFRALQMNETSNRETLCIMSFNINGDTEDYRKRAPHIVELIKNQGPDIVFVAEFNEASVKALDTLLVKYFPYSTFTGGYAHYFYSKFPLGKQIRLSEDSSAVGIYRCNVAFHNDSVTLYGCHFKSNNYTRSKKYVTPDSINSWKDVRTYFRDIHNAYTQRTHESDVLVYILKNGKGPVIAMGDFNDVGGSETIKKIEDAGLKDAWWEGGVGYGATIHSPLPFRIDHILYSKQLKLVKVKKIDAKGVSDHDALFAEFDLMPN